MKNQLFILLALVALLCVGCNISERIVFNDDMSGQYESAFDMSSIMKLAKQATPEDPDKEYKVMDTLMVFSEIMETYKDSISQLSVKEQTKLEKLKGMTMRMHMDEREGIFKMKVQKGFSNFDQIAFISNDMNDLFDVAKQQGGANEAQSPVDDFMKAEPVTYTFENNVFRRVDIETLKEEDTDFSNKVDENTSDTKTESNSEMGDQLDEMMGQFTEVLKKSTMTLEYVFPRVVASVSHEGATVSDDGKTVTFVIDMHTLQEEKELLKSFEVVLEEK
tara:strand:- start:4590 stop:5420 length:831 start_codon:yes stop_codon:yes gene_type:complete